MVHDRLSRQSWPMSNLTRVLICCVVFVLVAAIATLVILCPWKKLATKFAAEPDLAVSHSVVVHVNMTTIPERFESDWFAANMRRMMTSMRGNFVWWCNVPPSFGSTGQLYVVTQKVKQLLADFPNFRLFYTAQDWGPITKMLGGLHNPDIKLTDAMLICDDDVQYLPDFVQIAAAHFAKNPSRVYTYCGSGVLGFRGYLVQKMMCLALTSNMPASCRRIDDDLLDMYFQGHTTAITYHGSTEPWCTIDGTDWGDWHTEQHIALSRDNRPPMVAACKHDYNLAKKDMLSSTFLALEAGAVHKQLCPAVLSDYYPTPAELSSSCLDAPAQLGKVPKIIWRTAADDSWKVTCRSAFDKTASTNPDWQQRVLTDKDVMQYIRTTYASVQPIIDVAERIQLGVLLADLWRLLILFDQGGLYLDLKCPAVQPIENRLSLATNKAYVCQWKTYRPQAHLFKGGEFVNWAIMSAPRNPAIWAAICQVVANLQACQLHEDHRFMLVGEAHHETSMMKNRVLCTTGPIAFTHAVLTRSANITVVASNMNGAVRYTPPKMNEMLAKTPNHYSKYTRRFLNAKPGQACVPRILHLSWKSHQAVPQKVWQNIVEFVPTDFDVRFYSDDDCATYMSKLDKHGKIGSMYAAIENTAHKADAFRYAIMYQYGGVWLDIKTVLLQPIDSFLDMTVELTTAITSTSKAVYQGVLACAPNMAIMSQCLTDALELGKPHHGRNYLSNIQFLTKQLESQLSAKSNQPKQQLQAGRNQGLRFDFDLALEDVQPGNAQNKDRYNFDSNIYSNNKKVIKTRYDDFPWK